MYLIIINEKDVLAAANSISMTDDGFVKNNDESGHGTAVASIVAQCANEVSFVIVKLRQYENITECKTTSLICAICRSSMPINLIISSGDISWTLPHNSKY